MRCKFCGCSDASPCFIPPSYIEDAVAAFARSRRECRRQGVPCSWLLLDVCTAPSCVERAYEEACKLVDTLLYQEIAA